MAKDKEKNGGMLTSEELSVFCDQIALMLESGMTLRDGIDMLAEDEEKQAARVRPYSLMRETVEETGSLYIAMKEREDEWPHYMVEMVGIGEETGRLEDIMRNLSSYYLREGKIKDAASSAVTYPLVLGVMLAILGIVVIMAANKFFSLIHYLPEHVTSWIGQQIHGLGEKEDQAGVKSIFIASTNTVSSGAQGARELRGDISRQWNSPSSGHAMPTQSPSGVSQTSRISQDNFRS